MGRCKRIFRLEDCTWQDAVAKCKNLLKSWSLFCYYSLLCIWDSIAAQWMVPFLLDANVNNSKLQNFSATENDHVEMLSALCHVRGCYCFCSIFFFSSLYRCLFLLLLLNFDGAKAVYAEHAKVRAVVKSKVVFVCLCGNLINRLKIKHTQQENALKPIQAKRLIWIELTLTHKTWTDCIVHRTSIQEAGFVVYISFVFAPRHTSPSNGRRNMTKRCHVRLESWVLSLEFRQRWQIFAAASTTTKLNRTTTVWLLYGCFVSFSYIYLLIFPLYLRTLSTVPSIVVFLLVRHCRRCRHLLLLLLKIKCECLYLVEANCTLYVHWMMVRHMFLQWRFSSCAVLLIKMDFGLLLT